MTKKKSNKKEIIWNVVNSLLAAGLVVLGACADGSVTWRGLIIALIAGGIVALSQFKEYWETEKSEYSTSKIFKIF